MPIGKTIKKESVKIAISVIKKVKSNKIKTGIAVGTFFEQAAIEKLKRGKK